MHNGEEFETSVQQLIKYGEILFRANFTSAEGAGRPLTKGTGLPISDPSNPLVFPRNRNRISGPDANSCAGCHNQPIVGGFGDLATSVFVLGQRFDFASFNTTDGKPTAGGVDELGHGVNLQTIANSRSTTDMFGSGYYEMLARQITRDLQAIRDNLRPGEQVRLTSKGISFGVLRRRMNGAWDTSDVEGLPPQSTAAEGAQHSPTLVIFPFHQAGAVVSLRQFTVNSFNQHLGMQATERFGFNSDPDGDKVTNELTVVDITAITVFQATLPVPGRKIPETPDLRAAVKEGERLFSAVGCASCHIPALPLDRNGWIYTEPNQYNPPGNLQVGESRSVSVDLTAETRLGRRLKPENGAVMVPLYTDFKLHDLCSGQDDPNRETLNQNEAVGSPKFFAGNARFLTRRLWTVGSKPNFFHHGEFTTIREAILNHFGEAFSTQKRFSALSSYQQGTVVEFLKTLRVTETGE
jgi:mono/diheme cytochrome c family protein